MLSRFFIYRPIFASVISIVIIIAGAVSQITLPVAKFPEISPPTVRVTAFYPGANAKVVADTVASPIEQEVNGVENSIYMSSTSADDGSYTLTVTFEIGTDMDMASVLVQNRVSIAEPKLPEDVRRQGITTKKQSTSIVQFITLTSTNPAHDELFLSNFASKDIKDELSRIRGVGDVMVFGAADYSMRIWLDPERIKYRNLTTGDIVAAIREQNVQVAAGRIGQSPAPRGTDFEYTINTLGRLETPEQFGDLIIKTGDKGQVVRLKDVARVQLGGQDYNRGSKLNGKPCATLSIYQLPGANALQLASQISATMKKIEKENPAFRNGLIYEIPFDTTRFVTASITEVYETLFVAVVLVIIVIFVFLQDWRTTLIPCAAIPVSLIGTFAMMSAFGFSVNMLTLFGIVLAIGIVVDDAIVVVENTARHLELGLNSKDAAVKAMEEITGPVIATTVVLLAVFIPTVFMGGITGQLYRQFALTISGAVLISTLNALTLSPALCGILMRPSSGTKNPFFRLFNKGFDAVSGTYSFIINGMVRRIALVLIVFGGLVVLTGWGFTSLPTGFMPDEDQGYIFVNVQLPDAASKERTQAFIDKLDKIVAETPGVADRISVVGYGLLSGTNGSNQGFIAVVFTPWEERQSRQLQQEAILAHLRKKFYQTEEGIAFAFIPPAIDGLGVAGGFQMQVLASRGATLPQLQAITQDMIAAGNAQTGLTALNTTFRANVKQLFLDIDRTKVKSMDISLSSVFDTLQAYLGSTYVNDFNKDGRTYQVRIQADSKYRIDAEAIENLDVRNGRGEMVPIGTFLDVRQDFGAPVIQRYNMYPSAQLNGEPAEGFSSGQAMTLMEQLASADLPDSMSYDWTGMSYQEKLVGSEQYVVFLLAIVFVFLALAAQYESWSSPAAVIAVVPLAALGVVIALYLRNMDNNVYTQIGVVLLVALASKNAILIVEFAREQRSSGQGIREAAAKAAQLRFRAILMTAFSSILGFLPLVVASGAGAASRQAVGNAIVGGMIAATCFALIFVPSFFVVFQTLGEKFGGRPPDKPQTE